MTHVTAGGTMGRSPAGTAAAAIPEGAGGGDGSAGPKGGPMAGDDRENDVEPETTASLPPGAGRLRSTDASMAGEGRAAGRPRPIIIDTDPGQDDAVAILLALASDELDVLGITAVAGNVPLHLTERNARALVELAGRTDVPVIAGRAAPLERPLVTAEHVHGRTGIDGWAPPEPATPLAGRGASEWIVRRVMDAEPGTVTLCALGPLSNVASALRDEPRLAARLEGIVLMGGGYFEGGNITPMAEFNVFVDPEAADIVFRSGARIVMAPLDVTHKALIPNEFVSRMGALGSATGEAVAGMLDYFERFDKEKYGTSGGPLHDPCVIAWLLRPDIFAGRDCSVEIETRSELCRGATVIDWWNVWPERGPNAHVLADVDAPVFFDLLSRRLARLP